MIEDRKSQSPSKGKDISANRDDTPTPTPPKQPDGEVGGPAGPEPTRYGDWEVGGRCSDF
ncbi:MAG: succinate dehydrogenase assembly factor 4 [Pseudomonadota bacterium]